MSRRTLLSFTAVLVLAPSAAFTAAEPPPLGTLVMAKPIERRNPSYPQDAAWQWKEGWVLISFCVGVDGAVREPVIERSSGQKEFEKASLRAIRTWKYEPARLDGAPVEQCHASVRLSFRMAGVPLGARFPFAKKWREASRLIEEGKLFEATQLLDELKPSNNYEADRVALARARIAESTGDQRARLRHLRAALLAPEGLEQAVRGKVRRQVFGLEVTQSEWGAALESYEGLKAEHADELTVPEKLAGEELVALVASERPIATKGELECRCDRENGDPLWSARLLRREFMFADVSGDIDRFKLRCKAHEFTAKPTADSAWKVPESWGQCTLYVFGEEGATFRLVELPAQVAAAQAAP